MAAAQIVDIDILYKQLVEYKQRDIDTLIINKLYAEMLNHFINTCSIKQYEEDNDGFIARVYTILPEFTQYAEILNTEANTPFTYYDKFINTHIHNVKISNNAIHDIKCTINNIHVMLDNACFTNINNECVGVFINRVTSKMVDIIKHVNAISNKADANYKEAYDAYNAAINTLLRHPEA